MNTNRINELAKKSKNDGLTEEEKTEQKELRAQYIAEFRNNFQNQLNNVYIVDENGVETQLTEKKGSGLKN